MAEAGETVSVEQTSSSNLTRDNNLVEMVTALSENAGVSTSKQEVDSSEDLNKSCQDMFKTITEYLQGELNASLDDYDLLQKLNRLTTQKYMEMDNVTKGLITKMEQINVKYENLKPYMEMIDKVDASVANLEEAAIKLDMYTKELEARFKKLEKASS